MRSILFTICGRAGSKGFRNKNLKEIHGIPLVYYTLGIIKHYKQRHPDDDVVVAINTDSRELVEQVKKQSLVKDIEIVDRRPELAGDTAPKVAVIQDTYLSVKNCGRSFDHIIDLDITSPLRRVVDVEAIIDTMEKNEQYELAFSVVPSRRSPYFNMVELKEDGYYKKVCSSDFTARQQAPKCYELNASIYDYTPSFLEGKISKTILDYRCGIVIMPDYQVLDIDSEEDYRLLDMLISYYIENDIGINELYYLAKNY